MSLAVKIMDDAIERVQSIAQVSGKVVSAYSEEDLYASIRGITLPAVGVTYGGMRSIGEGTQPSNRTGNSAEVTINLIVLADKTALGHGTGKTFVLELLDDLRNGFMNAQSPSGHKYRFVREGLATEGGKAVIWMQTWTIPVQLPPR